jgi:hypothetical protein
VPKSVVIEARPLSDAFKAELIEVEKGMKYVIKVTAPKALTDPSKATGRSQFLPGRRRDHRRPSRRAGPQGEVPRLVPGRGEVTTSRPLLLAVAVAARAPRLLAPAGRARRRRAEAAPVVKAPRLLFTGADDGYLDACGCDDGLLGGLPRRHTLLKTLGAEDDDVLVLSNGGLVSAARPSTDEVRRADVGDVGDALRRDRAHREGARARPREARRVRGGPLRRDEPGGSRPRPSAPDRARRFAHGRGERSRSSPRSRRAAPPRARRRPGGAGRRPGGPRSRRSSRSSRTRGRVVLLGR